MLVWCCSSCGLFVGFLGCCCFESWWDVLVCWCLCFCGCLCCVSWNCVVWRVVFWWCGWRCFLVFVEWFCGYVSFGCRWWWDIIFVLVLFWISWVVRVVWGWCWCSLLVCCGWVLVFFWVLCGFLVVVCCCVFLLFVVSFYREMVCCVFWWWCGFFWLFLLLFGGLGSGLGCIVSWKSVWLGSVCCVILDMKIVGWCWVGIVKSGLICMSWCLELGWGLKVGWLWGVF